MQLLQICACYKYFFLINVYFCRHCQQEFRTAAQSPAQQLRTWNWATSWRRACREPMSSTSRTGKKGRQVVVYVQVQGIGAGEKKKSETDQRLACQLLQNHKTEFQIIYLFIYFYSVYTSLNSDFFSSLERASVAQAETKSNPLWALSTHFAVILLQSCLQLDKRRKVWTRLSNEKYSHGVVVLSTAGDCFRAVAAVKAMCLKKYLFD